jgi:hypothetical protein
MVAGFPVPGFPNFTLGVNYKHFKLRVVLLGSPQQVAYKYTFAAATTTQYKHVFQWAN